MKILKVIRKMSILFVLAGLLVSMVPLGNVGIGLTQAAPATDENPADKVENLVFKELESAGQTDFFVWMAEKADLSQAARLTTRAAKGQLVLETLRNTAARTQRPLRAYLDRRGVTYQTFHIANKILVRGGEATLVHALAARADVARITANHTYQLAAPAVSPNPQIGILAIEANLTFINADDVWADGYTGAGIVLAGSDTGLDWDHPAIKPHYRGWDGTTADHNYNWWDATGIYPNAPDDGHGHGTHTTGTMIGDDSAGNQIGVAPGAQTIHCKALDDSGVGNDATVTECLEWYLSPWDLTGSNPDPAQAPDAINMSLGTAGGNALQFENEITALQAAGILVEASAGNEGPDCGTLRSPGDYRGVLTTGSVTHTVAFPGTISSFSSRGPSQPYPGGYFPDVMAPGENIRSAQPGGAYTSMSGTSMAGPHVTGLVALMWEANPDLRGLVDQTAQLIADTAAPLTGQAGSDCGGDYTNGPNNDWGSGTIDADAAVQAALAYGSLGNIIRVTPTGATTGVCGADWSTPCNLLYALNSVATLGDELWVAAGVYKPTTDPDDQEAYIPLKTEVDVYGGFAGNETARWQRDPAANVTIFSGDIDDNDSQSPIVTDAYAVTGTTTNSYHVVAGTPTGATLDGVTITGGYGYYGCAYGWEAQFGGGLYTQGAMTLNNVTFSGNQTFDGGGLYTTAPLTVTNSTFTGNYATGDGGGLHNGGSYTVLLINVDFTNNRAGQAAGARSGGTLILNNVTFTDNWGEAHGGGLYASGVVTMTDVTFTRNHNSGMVTEGTQPMTLDQVTFTNNSGHPGSGLRAWNGNITLKNATFSGNLNGAIYLYQGSLDLDNVLVTGNAGGYAIHNTSGQMTLTHVTLANNGAALRSYTSSGVVIRNSIIWNNGSDNICPEGGEGGYCHAPTISHSIVWGGWAGVGNLNADPLLAPLGNYGGAILSSALLPGSPAIDMGDPPTCLATDMRGLARSSPCDVGAFESQGFTLGSLTGAPQSATLNGAFIDPLGLTVTANDLNEPVAGGQVSFSAPGSGASATFTGNPATIGASDTASLTATANDVLGSYVVTATVGTSSTPVQFTLSNVEGVSTTTTLTSAPNPSEYNETVAFTATVTSTVGTPIGTVQFYADGAPLGGPVSLVDGVARASTSSLNTGVHPIVANYRGDSTHNVSTSNQVDQTVNCVAAFTVTNANNDGVGSLRYAFDALCAGGAITFDDNYTVTLSSALAINKGMTISGAGHRVTLDANHASRVFEIAASGVTLDHLTLTGGQAPLNCGPWTDYCGGAIWMEGTGSNVVLQNSTLSGNSANRGGGVYNYQGTLTVLNSVITGNSGSAQGGGIFTSYGTVDVTNSTFSGNASAQGGAIYNNVGNVSIANGIQWGNSGGGLGENNLGADPRFVAPISASAAPTTTGNYRLGPGSPAIDRGSNAAAEQAGLTTDRDGNPRIVSGVVDMGAYEAPPQSVLVLLDKAVAPTLDVPEDGVVTYTLVARNVGTEDDTPAVLTDTLPRGVVFKQWVAQPAGAVANTQAITWTGTLTGNATLTLTFQATRTVAAAGEWAINTAHYSGTIHTTQASAKFAPTCADAITVQNAQTDGPGSLNDAIIGLCPGGTITFADDAAIYLNGPLDIRKDMTIDGDGHRVILSGDSGNDGSRNTRVVNIAPGNAVTLSHLSIVSGTTTGAGGGIYNEGDLTVLHSTIADNTAPQYGGGIRNVTGTLVVRNSTLSGNHADLNGGGINSTAMVTLVNSTLTGNTSDLEDGGGGIWQAGGQLAYYNTVIANSGNGGDCLDGEILANVHNLVEDGGCSAGGVGFLSGDPLLGPLADNGGGAPTHAPLPGSPAIDAGDPATCLATDQRGALRPQGVGCDIGAIEILSLLLSKSVTPTVNVPYHGLVTYTLTLNNTSLVSDTTATLTDILPAEVDFGDWVENHGATVSLDDQITWSGVVTAGTQMTFTFTATHTGDYAETVDNTATFSSGGQWWVSGADTAAFTVECSPAHSVQNGNDSGPGSLRQALMEVCAGGTVTFADDFDIYLDSELLVDKALTIDGSGRRITVSGNDVVRVVKVSNNAPVTLANLTITGGRDTSSECDGHTCGGGLKVDAGAAVTLTHSMLVSNTAYYGGGIFNYGTLRILHSTIAYNVAESWDGGIYSNGSLVVENSTISGNTAGGNTPDGNVGGLASAGSLTLRNSTIVGNTSAGDTGGLRQQGVAAYLYNTIIANNSGMDCDLADDGALAANVHNLVEDGGSCSAGGVGFLSADPLLGPLADNGGDTWTHALLTGSPAINAGDAATCLVTDQRGVTRSSPCDIGAFELQGFIITPLAGTGGSITPDTPQIVATGDDVTFTIAADTGYHTVDVGVDGVSQGALASYTFSNVTADHTITATFALDTYIITPTAGAGGSISPATAQTVNHGDDQAFTIAANAGYHIVDVGVDGVSQGALASYTFSNVTADHTITATFALLPPGAPTLLAPLRHTVTDTTELTLTWAPVDGATGYTVDLGGVIMDVGDTVISPTGVLATGAYTWTVAAYNAGGIGAYADTWAFAITGAPVNVTLTELTAGTVITFGNEICGSITFTNVGTLPTSLTITYTYNFPSVDHKGLLGQYRISAGGDAGYQAALTLCYADADLRVADIDPAQEPNLHAYRYIAVGQPWQQYSEVDTVANTITAHNVTTFGVFGVGITENQPTAITLGAFTARGGHWFSGLLLVVVLYGLRRKQPLVSQASPRKELQMEVQADVYTAPEIVYEGNLEIQAGSPLSIPSDFEDFEDLDW